MTNKDGLQRVLEFLSVLNEKSVEFRLSQHAPESITVEFSLVGARIEAYFEVGAVYYSIFKGDEAVELDFGKLMSMIEEKTK